MPHDTTPALMATDIPAAHPRIPYFRRMAGALGAAVPPLPCRLVLDGAAYAGRKSLDAVRSGAVQMAWLNASHLEALAPGLAVLNLPFGPADDVLREPSRTSALVRQIDRHVRPAGVRALGLMRGADQLFVSPTRAVESPADLRGRRVRVAGTGVYESILRCFDAVPVAMPIPEIPDAFVGGALDFVFTSPGGWQTQFGLDARHGTQVPGLMFINYVLLAHAAWVDSLDGPRRTVLQDAADHHVTWAWQAMERDDAELLRAFAGRGAVLHTVADTAEWRRRTQALRDAVIREHPDTARALQALDK